eukprot:CAMPEP_0174322774 /NCGR_PEP_ID=MMETSP0810-20121108/11261_1 /TAXON_ID=73025 ORGANISM="Eutreptiella gymnastica-like, Strain CCMP1594" /NCGR_SAMPLE_ID=MMETSP0810 /ASSEMBLY_ACC=CAM_ASM_000659 /LENGTH=96 /DNA_ID=CAMNT_0015434773 /DNA_START=715 /DNA_END=1005 /DNA_ORIENTATION=+
MIKPQHLSGFQAYVLLATDGLLRHRCSKRTAPGGAAACETATWPHGLMEGPATPPHSNPESHCPEPFAPPAKWVSRSSRPIGCLRTPHHHMRSSTP